jgi:hypothetical protein
MSFQMVFIAFDALLNNTVLNEFVYVGLAENVQFGYSKKEITSHFQDGGTEQCIIVRMQRRYHCYLLLMKSQFMS